MNLEGIGRVETKRLEEFLMRHRLLYLKNGEILVTRLRGQLAAICYLHQKIPINKT